MRTFGFFLILTFMLTLFRMMPKVMFGLIIFLMVVGSVLYIYLDIEYKEKEKQISLVTVTVAYNMELCPVKYPLRIAIINDGNGTVNKVNYEVAARQKGYSDNLVHQLSSFVSNKIIHSGKDYSVCSGLPPFQTKQTAPHLLVWSIDYKRIWFKKTE